MLRTVEAILSHLDFDTINKWIAPVAGTNTGYPHGELRVSNETASFLHVSWATVPASAGDMQGHMTATQNPTVPKERGGSNFLCEQRPALPAVGSIGGAAAVALFLL
jgi:hypothetical protein